MTQNRKYIVVLDSKGNICPATDDTAQHGSKQLAKERLKFLDKMYPNFSPHRIAILNEVVSTEKRTECPRCSACIVENC